MIHPPMTEEELAEIKNALGLAPDEEITPQRIAMHLLNRIDAYTSTPADCRCPLHAWVAMLEAKRKAKL